MDGMELLFSSDSFIEYEKDIYAICSLPQGYCYHFRYPAANTSEYIKTRYTSRQGAPALIIFVTGNKGPEENRRLGFIPIRQATIHEITFDSATNYYHVYFRLGDYASIRGFDAENLDESPLHGLFLAHQVIQPEFEKAVQWLDLVQQLHAVRRILFFRVDILDENHYPEIPSIEPKTNLSYYRLREGKSYYIKVSIADFNNDKERHEIRSVVKASDLSTNLAETINSGLEIDHEFYKLSGLIVGDQSIKVNWINLASWEKIPESADRANYSVRLLFEVRKNYIRLAAYFGLSVLFYLGAGLIAADLSKYNSPGTVAWKIFGLICVSGATAALYFRFNKK